jgi:hypothetical protein
MKSPRNGLDSSGGLWYTAAKRKHLSVSREDRDPQAGRVSEPALIGLFHKTE